MSFEIVELKKTMTKKKDKDPTAVFVYKATDELGAVLTIKTEEESLFVPGDEFELKRVSSQTKLK